MKIRTFFVALMTLLLISVQPYKSFCQAHAGEYMTKINTTYQPIRQDLWDYMKTVANNRGARKVEKRRTELLTSVSTAKTNIRKIAPWEGDASMRDSVVAFLSISYNIINQDFAKIVDMEAVAEQSYDAMEAYLMVQEAANKKYSDAGEKVSATSKKFAETHGVTLLEPEDDKLSKKMRMADSVYKYYNRVYLVMFKAKVEEDYALKAFNESNYAGAEQNKTKLLEFSVEGLKKLAGFAAFAGDASVRDAAVELLKFYKSEAETKLPFMIDFHLKKENMDKMRAALEAKPADKRTKEEVDGYNKELEAYNKLVLQFNTMTQETNAARGKAMDKWNNSVAAFTSKHVPNR